MLEWWFKGQIEVLGEKHVPVAMFSQVPCTLRRVTNDNLFLTTEPPSAPQNLTVGFVDQSTVILSWTPPHFQGGRVDTVYRVECDSCGPGVSYNPSAVSIQCFIAYLHSTESQISFMTVWPVALVFCHSIGA